MERHEIVISGFGGQGVVLGGIILAEAAAIYENKNATHNQSYGPEARGGASKSEVIISDKTVHYPEIERPDILVALTKEAALKFGGSVKEKGILILDANIKDFNVSPTVKLYSLPIIKSAVEEVGKEIVTNIVTLGALAAITKVVGKEALKQAVLYRVPKGTEELNLKAVDAGFTLGEQA